MKKDKEIGKTKDVGFQIGVRKTLPINYKELWDFVFSKEGLKIWLGNVSEKKFKTDSFKTKEGIEGNVTVFKEYSHIRMKWKPLNWESVSTLQIRVIESGEKSTLSFHQEKLLDSEQREEMKEYWKKAIDLIEKKIIH